MLGILLIYSLASPALGLCEAECQPVSSLLRNCSLPPLSTDANTIGQYSGTRNLTGLAFAYPSYSGPTTAFISTAEEAACFCTEARVPLDGVCPRCFLLDMMENGMSEHNEHFINDKYSEDCAAFGYYSNETLKYPTTTRTAMPSSTGSSNPPMDENTCESVCGVIRAQTEQCDLTSLDAERAPSRTIVGNGLYQGRVLLNRTEAQCMCSMPVLRRLRGCRVCIEDEADAGSQSILDFYQEDCNALGYWSDSDIVQPALGQDGGNKSSEDSQSDPSAADGSGRTLYVPGYLLVGAVGLPFLSGYMPSLL